MRANELNTAVFTFGRMNPPTIGHKKVIDTIKSLPGKPFLFLTHTQNAKKDPLSFEQKLKFAKQSFSDITIGDPTVKTIIQAMQTLQKKGYANVVLVVGSDRVPYFSELLPKYNGKDYKFDSIKVVTVGVRDEESDDNVEGMSASKMRQAAVDGDFESFKQGVANPGIAKEMYDAVRTGMNIPTETTESTEEEAWELLGQQEPNIQKFVKTLGLQNNQQSVEKLVPMIRNAQTSIINPNQIATLQNLANKGPADIQALRSILKIKGTPEAPQQFAKIMQQRDQAEGRNRGYDVGRLINDINTGKYESPVVLKTNSGMVVVGGRTRLYAALALNKSIKVKVLDPNKLDPAEGIQEEVSQKPKVYVDMDGVIADFFSALAKFRKVNHWKDKGEISVEDSIKAIAGTDFFSTLPLFATSKELINIVKSFTGGEWYICSSPLRGDHENSKKHKLDWLRSNGFTPNGVIITGRKESYAVDKTTGLPNILIDDKPSNIERWQAKGGIGIRYQANKDNLNRVSQALKYVEKQDLSKVAPINKAINSGSFAQVNEGDLIPFPDNTLVVDIDSKSDYYELTKDISNLDQADRKKYGPNGKPDTLVTFQSEKVKNEYKKRIKKHTGLNSRDTKHTYLYHDPDTKQVNEWGGRVVKGVNTTVDVGVDAITKQSAKLGFKVDRDGRPPNIREKKSIFSAIVEDELKFQNDKGDKSLLTLPGTSKYQKMKKTSEPGTDKWFKAYRTLPLLTKGRKNHYMLPVKERIEILEQELKELQEKWSAKYKKSIDCTNPKGFSQKAHCAGRKKK